MSYEETKPKIRKRKRKRKLRDPLTGELISKQRRLVDGTSAELFFDDFDHFDRETFNHVNSEACDIFNVSSMAAAAGYSKKTFVNSVFPTLHSYEAGPVKISCTNSVSAGGERYRAKQRAKQQEAGEQNSGALIRWIDPSSSDLSSGAWSPIRGSRWD